MDYEIDVTPFLKEMKWYEESSPIEISIWNELFGESI